VPVADLQAELCPRISAADLLDLLQRKKQKLMTVDIRTTEEYSRGTVPGSIHIPWSSGSVPDISTLQSNKGRITVVLGAHAVQSANVSWHCTVILRNFIGPSIR
jgi:rhodanese-related sulfurtransferase